MQDRAQLVAKRAPQRRVERRQRLVEQQERGIDGERAGEGDPLALAARELARPPAGELGEAEPLEDLPRFLGAPRARQVAQAEGHVVGDGEVREQRVALEDVADPPRLRRHVDARGGIEENAPVHDDAAGVGAQESRQAVEREGLARPRRAEEHRHAIARRPRHVEREARQPRDDADVEAVAHAARAPSHPAATSTTHDSAVRIATSASVACCSPVCTAV